MTKQNSDKSKKPPKPTSSMTNRAEYRTRNCLNDDQKIAYDKVKRAIIDSWQKAKNHGSYKSAAIREEHLSSFMNMYPKINDEPIKRYKKLLMGVLKDQAKSNKVLKEEGMNKTALIQTSFEEPFDDELAGND